MRQTEIVRDRILTRWPAAAVRILAVSSAGDIRSHEPISRFGDKGVFVARIERALLDNEADIAVHSLKDLPGDVPDHSKSTALTIAAYLPREDPRDVLIARDGRRLAELPIGARVGTSSLRRRVQLALVRPDLEWADIRGNVDTRLRKLGAGEYDAIVLAAAGLLRLGLGDVITEYLEPSVCLPAPGQGIIAVQCRADHSLREVLREIDDQNSRIMATAERALARGLGAGCNTPMGALATVQQNTVILQGVLMRSDGQLVRATDHGPASEATHVAEAVARQVQS